jgi:multicomponent Na+:H+ antiporter subunit D
VSPGVAIVLALGLPLVAALAAVVLSRRPDARETVTLILATATFLVVLSLLPHAAGGTVEVRAFDLLAGVPLALHVEPLGMLFALVASGLWIVTTCYSIGYMRGHHETNHSRFFACFAIAIFGALGVAFAANLLVLFAFYEVLTLSTYPLVTHRGTVEAMRGGRIYLGVLLTTSISLLLLAVVWTWTLAGTLDFRPGGILAGRADATAIAILLALFAFGTGKAALMPFHRWLPAAMVAPTPVSALLHAVAVVKAGVFTVLKVVVYVFGLDVVRASAASRWLVWVAAATILLASLVALRKDNLKARLAYSTVGQLSYIVLGAMLANAWGIVGGGMHIATHAFGKITLFFCSGAIAVAAHKTEISEMRGIGRSMPITTAAFLVGSLSIVGLPPFGGTWSKWYLALGAASAGEVALVCVLMASSLLSLAYLVPIAARGFFLPPDDGPEWPAVHEAPLLCVVPLCVTAAGCVALFFFAEAIERLLAPLAGG